MATPICPLCNQPAEVQRTSFGVRHECCGLHSWDGKPLVGQDVHDARRAAHAAFDKLWKGKDVVCSRGEAYRRLCLTLNCLPEEAHMATMCGNMAKRVPAAVEKIRANLRE